MQAISKAVEKVIVTGGSGKAGRAVVRDLVGHGYEVANLDLVAPAETVAPFTRVDLTDYGQTADAFGGIDARMAGADAVVHLAAIPGPGREADARTFAVNTTSTYNVFRAAARCGIRRVVWASSETVLGLPFDIPPPYAPLDEEAPVRPEWSYALSKVMGEEMARHFARWHPDMAFVGLRYSNILDADDYAAFPTYWEDARLRKWNLWGYVDVRDAAQAARRGLEAEVSGADVFIIAAADTVMNRPSRALMDEVFPGVPVADDLGPYDTLLAIDKARRVLGYAPQHSWRRRA